MSKNKNACGTRGGVNKKQKIASGSMGALNNKSKKRLRQRGESFKTKVKTPAAAGAGEWEERRGEAILLGGNGLRPLCFSLVLRLCRGHGQELGPVAPLMSHRQSQLTRRLRTDCANTNARGD